MMMTRRMTAAETPTTTPIITPSFELVDSCSIRTWSVRINSEISPEPWRQRPYERKNPLRQEHERWNGAVDWQSELSGHPPLLTMHALIAGKVEFDYDPNII
jgi:hypothetical protein